MDNAPAGVRGLHNTIHLGVSSSYYFFPVSFLIWLSLSFLLVAIHPCFFLFFLFITFFFLLSLILLTSCCHSDVSFPFSFSFSLLFCHLPFTPIMVHHVFIQPFLFPSFHFPSSSLSFLPYWFIHAFLLPHPPFYFLPFPCFYSLPALSFQLFKNVRKWTILYTYWDCQNGVIMKTNLYKHVLINPLNSCVICGGCNVILLSGHMLKYKQEWIRTSKVSNSLRLLHGIFREWKKYNVDAINYKCKK